jgi:hypothetical protein
MVIRSSNPQLFVNWLAFGKGTSAKIQDNTRHDAWRDKSCFFVPAMSKLIMFCIDSHS